MKKHIRRIFSAAFWQLLAVYAVLTALTATGVFWKYSFQFHFFALVVAVFGIISAKTLPERKISKKTHCLVFAAAILLIILLRTIPYIRNDIPLGYDLGIYKYGIEHGLKNLDSWILNGGMEPGFLYLMEFFKAFFSTQFILTWLLICFSTLLGIVVYLAAKEYAGRQTGLIALLIYSLSAIQFKAFSYMYYKNIIGMSLMLFALYFLKKSEKSKKYLSAFVIAGGITGWIHRPSFYIFGLAYLAYAFIQPCKNRKYSLKFLRNNILAGIGIILIAALPYLGRFRQAILIMFEPVLQGFLQPGEAPGTFINFFTYQFSILPYLPLAILGIAAFIKRKEINALVIWAFINLAIVYFQFFFFNRFIIFLDLALIIMAAYGVSGIIRSRSKAALVIIIILVLSLSVLAFRESISAKPLINKAELDTITSLNKTEQGAFGISASAAYAPWLLGYSERRIIAPGMFDYNLHNKSEWEKFWNATDIQAEKKFLNAYEKPLYIFIGEKQRDFLAQFNTTGCFSIFSENSSSRVYRYEC